MKIVEFRAENFKRLSVVEIKPTGNMVQITGKNEQGKSSVLDAILAAIAGKDACPSVPIRRGEDSASIELDLGELIVTRHFGLKEDGDYTTSVTVEKGDGARYPSPQSMLDALFGALSFDPLAFAHMKPDQQFNELRRFVPDVDFDAIAAADKGDRDRRTELGRYQRQEAAAAQAIVVPQDTPEEEIDESHLVETLEEAGRANAQLEHRRANRERAKRESEQAKQLAAELALDAQRLREQADDAEARAKTNLEKAAQLDEQLAKAGALPEVVDTAPIRASIDKAKATNANVRRLSQRRAHIVKAEELEKQIETVTASIEKRQADKNAAIAAAKMPVEGLGFGDGVVLMNGLPFDQASGAGQLRTSAAIAMAINPALRIILIRDGSRLDEDGLQLLATIADENDMQVWIERVDSSGRIGFVLEDGHLRKVDEASPERAAPAQKRAAPARRRAAKS